MSNFVPESPAPITNAPAPEDKKEGPPPDITKLVRFLEGPLDIRSLALTGLFVLACFYVLSVGRVIFLPITVALLLNFLLAPIIRAFKKISIPESVSAAVVLLAFGAIVAYGGYRLSAPAADWMAKAPQAFREVNYKLRVLKKPVEEMHKTTEMLGDMTSLQGSKKLQQVEIKPPPLSDTLFSVTGEFFAGLVSMLILLYFLLASGNLFLQKLVKVIPRLQDKKRAVEIVRQIEDHVSKYLATVTCINTGLGVAVGLAMLALGMPNPILWGTMAALLTFVPYLGHVVGVAVIMLVAALTFDEIGWILLVGVTYWVLAAIEGTFVTPMILGQRLTLNPVVLLLGLLLWGWIWGIGGALIAVPLIAVVKIFFDHIEPLAPIGEFLGR